MSLETKIHIDPAHVDDRGSIVNVLRNGIIIEDMLHRWPFSSLHQIKHVAVITSVVDAVRANHWHPLDVQAMILISGRYRSVARRHGTLDPPEEIIVDPWDLVITPPGIDHAQHITEASVFLNLNTENRAPDEYAKHTIPLIGSEILIPSVGGFLTPPLGDRQEAPRMRSVTDICAMRERIVASIDSLDDSPIDALATLDWILYEDPNVNSSIAIVEEKNWPRR